MEIGVIVRPYSRQFADALEYSARVHGNQRRKGTLVPYIGHLLGVTSIVIDHGGTEDEAIAALLHDAPEDQGGVARLNDIEQKFGRRVATIVAACSDSLVERPSEKADWRERKTAYLKQLSETSDVSAYLVSAADKLHNARTLISEYRTSGESIWSWFKGGRDGTLWNYNALLDAYIHGPEDERRNGVVEDLREAIRKLET